MTKASKQKPDCLTCGLCCIAPYDQDVFADVDDQSLERLLIQKGERWALKNIMLASPFDRLCDAIDGGRSPGAAIKTHWKPVKTGPMRGCRVCACVALRGDPAHKVSCSIYEHRPESCRKAIQPGDNSCLAIRKAAGIV